MAEPLTVARALVTSKWKGGGYRQSAITQIESYYVDTSLDNDSDAWHIEIGDSKGDFAAMLVKDNEVRVTLLGFGHTAAEPILTGITDDVDYKEGLWSLTGRDLSSLATDSAAPPFMYKNRRASSIVAEQARSIGISNTSGLTQTQHMRKQRYTDGSESYWEFWYRMYRKEGMFIWLEPDGALMGSILNYNQKTSYYFGSPNDSDPPVVKKAYLPVAVFEGHKTNQTRLSNVWVYFHDGKGVGPVKLSDPNIKDWVRKPLKIMLDTDATIPDGARKLGLEEIFESQVGAVEHKVVVADPGYVIHQNRMAHINIPDEGIEGDFFIVGVRTQAGPEGMVCEVRLREKKYAISRRIPADPQIQPDPWGQKDTPSGAGSALGIKWADFFIKAARQWRGPWDFSLFLAVLLGMCEKETNFQNERENGGPGGGGEWYPRPTQEQLGVQASIPGAKVGPTTLSQLVEEWKTKFANDADNPRIAGVWGRDAGVGPMQLTSHGLKLEADAMFKGGGEDEYEGGRWHPEFNILVGAHRLRTGLQATVGDTGRDTDIWAGVGNYNGSGTTGEYAQSVKKAVMSEGGWLDRVTGWLTTEKAEEPATGGVTDKDNKTPQGSFENSKDDLAKLTRLKPDSNADIVHVNYILLSRANAVGNYIGKNIVITSGFRSLQEQIDIWERSGHGTKFPAANPYTGKSNHQIGEAIDCTVNGSPIGEAVSAATLAAYKTHALMNQPGRPYDPVHLTRIEVDG